MARLARVVLPGVAHHVTQRGNGRQQTFFEDADYRHYRDLLVGQCLKTDTSVLGWCLMPNHVHLILVPKTEDSLRQALSQVHRRYAGHIHAREQRTGHFWQGRFGCVAMDDDHLVAAMAYGALNPVRARLVAKPEDWKWSSARLYRNLGFKGDPLVRRIDIEPYIPAVRALIAAGEEDARVMALRKAETIGRPVGGAAFMKSAEKLTKRKLTPGKRGPKPRAKDELNALSP